MKNSFPLGDEDRTRLRELVEMEPDGSPREVVLRFPCDTKVRIRSSGGESGLIFAVGPAGVEVRVLKKSLTAARELFEILAGGVEPPTSSPDGMVLVNVAPQLAKFEADIEERRKSLREDLDQMPDLDQYSFNLKISKVGVNYDRLRAVFEAYEKFCRDHGLAPRLTQQKAVRP
jgi:hypothetical protein